MNTRFVNCEHCQTEGRIYTASGNDPDWTDHGVCPECKGERVVEVETEPATPSDDEHSCPCGGYDCGMLPSGPLPGCPFSDSDFAQTIGYREP